MKNLKTFEGFFDFLKKKNYSKAKIQDILDCLLPLTDNESIKSDLNGNVTDGIFHTIRSQMFSAYDCGRTDNGKFYVDENIFFFHMQYSPISHNYNYINNHWIGISDDDVNNIMKECQDTLEGLDCKITFFIGRGVDEGRSWDTEFSDINKMVDKTVKRMEYGQNCVRNITVKINCLGGIEE